MYKNIRKILLFVVVVMTMCGLHAQQAPIFTNYSNSYAVINPGYYGLSEGVNTLGIYRNQWSGFKDGTTGKVVSPRTFLVSADMPISSLRGGIGISVMNDQIGLENNVAFNVGYSYHLDLGAGTMGLGLALSLNNRKVDFANAHPLNEDDPVIPTSAQNDMLFDFNIGLFYTVPETFYIAFSTTNLMESKGKALQGKSTTSASFVGDRTFYIAAGYEYQFFNPMFKLNPSLMILSDVASTQYNLSSRLWYNNRMCFGVNYRYKESIGLLAGFTIKGIQINYAYDINIMGLKIPGSHEVSISYNFKLDLEKSPRIYRSIRYL